MRRFNEEVALNPAPGQLDGCLERLDGRLAGAARLCLSTFQTYFFFCLSSDDSSGLFSCGLTVERTTITLLRRSNQKGAPIEIAAAVKSQPISGARKFFHH